MPQKLQNEKNSFLFSYNKIIESPVMLVCSRDPRQPMEPFEDYKGNRGGTDLTLTSLTLGGSLVTY